MTSVELRERRSGARALGRYLVGFLLVALTAFGLGSLSHQIPRSAQLLLFAAVPALLVLGFVVARGPRACLAMLVSTAVVGLNVHTIGGGQNGPRVIDIFWVALVGWALLIRSREGPILGRQVGQRQVGLWLAALLVSLYPVAVYSSSGFGSAFIAWARLAETISLVWLVPYALRKIEDIEFMLGVIELSVAAAILFAIGKAAAAGDLGSSRLGGVHGPDSTGLLAALLIAASIHAPVPRHRAARSMLFAIGLTGLLLTKSVGSLAAAGVMLGVFGLGSMARKTSPHRGLLIPARLLFLVFAVLAVAAAVRPGSLPTTKNFDSSTTLARTVIAAGGLEIFRDHPIVGVGWSRGGKEVASDKIDRQLRTLFGDSLRPDFLPKQLGGVSSLHNAYIEMLAEAGLVGFACFVVLLFAGVSGIRSILRSVAGDPRVSSCAWCAVVLLVGVLVWWNDNALFGVQPETILAATFLGVLAAIPRAQRPAQTTAGNHIGQHVATS